jgi:putative NADPH-quinone reductase
VRILVLYAHPNPDSFIAACHRVAVAALTRAGHEVDDCDLYAEGFDPVLSLEERLHYLDVPENRKNVESYVGRVEQAEGLVMVHPVWNFGHPAILKGFFDRVFLPGVSFRLVEGLATPNLTHLKTLVTVTSYGAPRWRAFLMGDPPRKLANRMMRALVAPDAKRRYLALHDMNRQTEQGRKSFLRRVEQVMSHL